MDPKPSVAIIGSGPAALFAAWALRSSGHEVTVFEQHDHLTLARQASASEGTPRVDIPMRTFSGAYYANLFRVLNHLGIATRVHRFHYRFLQGTAEYFQFFSNFHRIIPCLSNSFWINLYVLACYVWYTMAVFVVPPRIKNGSSGSGETETLDQYAKRIRLPDRFLDWYLLPLFASVATCSHGDLRQCPAAYIADYRRRTFAAHHRTVSDIHVLQTLLTRNITIVLQAKVERVQPGIEGVEIHFTTGDGDKHQIRIFDRAIIATSAKQAGELFPTIRSITSRLSEGRVRISVTESSHRANAGRSETLVLMTQVEDTSSPVTHAIHHHPSGLDVVVSPGFHDAEKGPAGAELIYLNRPLPTSESHDLLYEVFGTASKGRKLGWKNGDYGIYLAGGYASASLPLLEACVRSALEAAVAIGADLPFEIVKHTSF